MTDDAVDVSRLSGRDWLDLDEAQQDPEHGAGIEVDGRRARGHCECGWRGEWQTVPASRWYAQADADDHYNDTADPRWHREITVTARGDDDEPDYIGPTDVWWHVAYADRPGVFTFGRAEAIRVAESTGAQFVQERGGERRLVWEAP